MMRFLAWLSAVFWVGLGIVFLLRMPQMAEGLAFTSPDGLTGLRAIVSGLHIAIGTVILVFCLNRLYLLGVFVSAWRSERTCDCQIVWNGHGPRLYCFADSRPGPGGAWIVHRNRDSAPP